MEENVMQTGLFFTVLLVGFIKIYPEKPSNWLMAVVLSALGLSFSAFIVGALAVIWKI